MNLSTIKVKVEKLKAGDFILSDDGNMMFEIYMISLINPVSRTYELTLQHALTSSKVTMQFDTEIYKVIDLDELYNECK